MAPTLRFSSLVLLAASWMLAAGCGDDDAVLLPSGSSGQAGAGAHAGSSGSGGHAGATGGAGKAGSSAAGSSEAGGSGTDTGGAAGTPETCSYFSGIHFKYPLQLDCLDWTDFSTCVGFCAPPPTTP